MPLIDIRLSKCLYSFRYIISFGATSGGYKDNSRLGRQYFDSQNFTKEVHVIFDTEKPVHCSRTAGNCSNDTLLASFNIVPVAFGLSEDITKVITFKFSLS